MARDYNLLRQGTRNVISNEQVVQVQRFCLELKV